jgi:hypothetical protein
MKATGKTRFSEKISVKHTAIFHGRPERALAGGAWRLAALNQRLEWFR